RARHRIGIVDHHLDRVAGRAVARRVGDHGAELVIAIGQTGLARRCRRPGAAAIGGDLIGYADAIGVVVAAQAPIEAAVLLAPRRLPAAVPYTTLYRSRARHRIGIVDHHLDRVAGRAVARRVGDHGAELVIAIGQTGLARRCRRPGAAAIGGDLIDHADAIGVAVAAQAQIADAGLGDRLRLAAAGVGQVLHALPTRRSSDLVDHHLDRVAGRAVARRVGDHGAELVIAIGQTGLARRCRRPGAAAIGGDLIDHADAIGVAVAA